MMVAVVDGLNINIYDMEKRKKGYIVFHERACCDICIFSYNNSGVVANQDVKTTCTKIEPNFEVNGDDVCDEYELLPTYKHIKIK